MHCYGISVDPCTHLLSGSAFSVHELSGVQVKFHVLMSRSALICRAARGEAEGWKGRTLQAESQIAELKLQVKDYRMQLGLPITDAEGSGAAPAALTWHQPDSRPEIGDPPV